MKHQSGTSHILKSHNILIATCHQDLLSFICSVFVYGIPSELAIFNREPHDTQGGITLVKDCIYVPPGPVEVVVLQVCHDFTVAGHLGR